MSFRWVWGWFLILSVPWEAAQAHRPHGGWVAVPVPSVVGGPPHLVAYSSRGSYTTVGPHGFPVSYFPPLLFNAPSGLHFLVGPTGAPVSATDTGIGVAGPWPPPHRGLLLPEPAPAPAPLKKCDRARSSQLVTIGDRLFRAGNTRRAAERYEQAVRADPAAAAPRIRLSQLALLRARYSEAALQLREALTTEPGWLAKAPDIESLYLEPADFARQVSNLETHLQANPGDRDAWLVLGAKWYLSGRTRKAADIFLRLSDRKPDPALAAFLDATIPDVRARR